MSLKFCIIIESNSQKTFFAIVLYTNMAALTSRENREYSAFVHCEIIGLIQFSCNCAFWDKEKLCNKLVVLQLFCAQSNENGRFFAQLGLAKLMSAREIEDVVFLGNTTIFEEIKQMTFLVLLRPTYMHK